MNTDPLVPVLPQGPALARCWPKHETGARIEYLPLSVALTRRFAGDAHASGYSVPSVLRRLGTDPPAYARVPGGVPMRVWWWDLDCGAAHKAMGGSRVVRADDAWWRETLGRCERLLERHPGGFIYRTRGGARIVYRLAEPLVLQTGADELEWSRLYLSALAYLARAFGIVCDPSIADWPRAIRLPRTTRDGVLQLLDTVGNPRAVGTFAYAPSAGEESADLDHVRRLAQRDPRWVPKLRLLARNAPAPERAARPRVSRAVDSTPIDAGELAQLAADLGRALQGLHGRHQVHLALAGACYARGVPLEQGPVLARAICAASGETDDRPQVWETTAEKVRAGAPHTGYGHLARHWPSLAALVDTALPSDGGAREAREELDARGVPAEISGPEAAAVLAAALRSAPVGLSLIAATEGAGKTRATVEVLRERARAATQKRVPSVAKTVYVAPDHAVAGSVAAQLTGERAAYWRGVLSVRKEDGSPACRHHLAVLPLVSSGHSARSFCEGCDQDGDCPAQEGAVVSMREDGSSPAVLIAAHAYLAEVLAWAGDAATVFVDEDPEAVTAHTITRTELEAAAGAEELFARAEAFRAPVLRALGAGLERGDLPRGKEALQEVFARGCAALVGDEAWCSAVEQHYGPLPLDADAVLTDYARRVVWTASEDEETPRRRSSWAPRLTWSARAQVYRRAVDGRLAPASATHALVAQLVAGVVRADLDGLTHDERGVCSVEVDHRDPSRRVLRAVIAQAAVVRAVDRTARTVLLDATGDAPVLEVVARSRVPVTDVRVADGAPVTRRLLYWSHASRATAMVDDKPRWDSGLARYLSEAIEQALAFCEKPRVAIFTWKALADVLRSRSDATAEALLQRIEKAGGSVALGHYGYARGRDDWMDADVLLSIGDPRPNLGSTRAIAAVLGLSAEHDRIYRHRTAAEVSQVGGRLRTPWRDRRALHVHVGTVPGLRWDSRADVLELPKGPATEIDPVAVATAVRVHGSKRLAAAALGVSRKSVSEISGKSILSEQSPAVTCNAIRIPTTLPVAASDSAESLEKTPERPPVPVSWSPERAQELVRAVGGAARAAALLGVHRAVVYHWAKGTRPMPRSAADELGRVVAAMALAQVPPTEEPDPTAIEEDTR